VALKKTEKESSSAVRARVRKEMAKPRFSRSAKMAELSKRGTATTRARIGEFALPPEREIWTLQRIQGLSGGTESISPIV